MIEYPYIPTVTGKTAEQLAAQTEYNEKHLRGSQAPSRQHREKVLKMFRRAGLFL
jgi:hypothetical protein